MIVPPDAPEYGLEKQDALLASNPVEGAAFDSKTDRNNDSLPPSYESQFSPSGSRGLAPSPSPGPSSAPKASGSSSSSFFSLGNKPSNLLNPPPPSFQRAPASGLPYSPFPPLTLLGLSSDLSAGFPVIPPPCITGPGGAHPFVTHDVNEEDWGKFLGDIKFAATLSPMDKVITNVAPLALGLGIVASLLTSKGLQERVREKKTGPVVELVDAWNQYFFNPRRLNLTLAQGELIYTGPNFGNVLPPTISRQEQEEYSSSDSESEGGHHHPRQQQPGAYPQQQLQPTSSYPSQAYPGQVYPGQTYPPQPYPVGAPLGTPLVHMPSTMLASPFQRQLYGQVSYRDARRADRDYQRAGRRELRFERRMMKRERRGMRREERWNRRSGERWRLVVEPFGI